MYALYTLTCVPVIFKITETHISLVLKPSADKQTKESSLGLKIFADKQKCVYLEACAYKETKESVYV